MSQPGPHADVSCRLAWGADALAIAAVQLRAWRADTPWVLPEALRAGDEHDTEAAAELAEAWAPALSRPGDARQRVLVALERATVTGYVLTSPATDGDRDASRDGELLDLVVDPARRREGHGSRLLQAAVDTLRADRFAYALTWLTAEDDARRGFLTGAGWAADGAHRALETDGGELRQVRLHTSLAED